MCLHIICTIIIFSIHHVCPARTILDVHRDWWTLCEYSGWAHTSVPSTWGQTAGIASSVLMRVTDHRECRVCCDERADGANERNGSEQLFRPFAAGGGWRRVRSCQTTGMTSGVVTDAVGRAAVLPWHQVRLCTVALDTAVAKAGMQHPRNVAGHILCWHLVTIVHTHTYSL